MFKAVIFDMDGVILDSEKLWMRVEARVLGELGHELTPELKREILGRGMADTARIFKETYNIPISVEEIVRRKVRYITELFETELELMPGFLEFYKKLTKYSKAMATSADWALIEIVDRKFGLRKLFPVITTVADVEKSKPAPDIFLLAAHRLGVPPHMCVVIEDAPAGVTAAKAAGMYCIGIENELTKGRLVAADQVVTSFPKIKIPK